MITFSFTIARPSVTVKADGVLPSGITVLTGQSGSGKSTFIKCIAGLVKPTTGSIQYNETIWVDRDNKIWVPAQKRQVGYMPQGNIVFPHLSVEHNITYSKRGTPDMCNSLLQRLEVQLAQTEDERAVGLMYRSSMEEQQGMWFVFENEAPRSFYMKNTLIPLDIIYLNKDKKVVSSLKGFINFYLYRIKATS